MELTGNGSRNRSVKNTGPGICENAGALGRAFFILMTIMKFESMTSDKRLAGDNQKKSKFWT